MDFVFLDVSGVPWEYVVEQLINAITLGSIYGLIAIGYTMVYGIIGMINFAHGEVFMIGAFASLLMILVLQGFGGLGLPLVLVIAVVAAMIVASCYGFMIERIAYRPLRGSFRLAPLITAIGMSIFLQNFVQINQGARNKPIEAQFSGGFRLWVSLDAQAPACQAALDGSALAADLPGRDAVQTQLQSAASDADRAAILNQLMRTQEPASVVGPGCPIDQIYVSTINALVVVVTVVVLAIFWMLITRTALGRAQRACEQDARMASLLGVNVNRTIALTFVMGASLAAVAGMMFVLKYGVIDFYIGFLAGVKAFTAAVLGGIGSLPGAMLGGLLLGLIEVFWGGFINQEYKDVAAFSILAIVLIFLPEGLLGRSEVEKV